MSVAARLADLVAARGRPVVLRRRQVVDGAKPWEVETQVSETSLPALVGRRRSLPAADPASVELQIWLAAASLAGPPAVGDEIVLDGRSHRVVAVDTRQLGGEALLHRTTLRA